MHRKETHSLNHSPTIRPADWHRFVQIDPFPKLWSKLQLDDDDLRALEIGIMSAPDKNPVVPGAGRLRKLRFKTPDSNRGKSGSYRVYYARFPEYGTILLLAVLAKNDQADLTKADRNQLAKVIERLEKLFEQGVLR